MPQKSYPFWLGGAAASWAAACTHPLDLMKVRMQTSSNRSMFGVLVESIRRDGLARGAYTGLTASLLRQMTYSVTRFGVYDRLKSQLAGGKSGPLPPWQMATAAAVAGVAGGIAGNPADIALVRMIGDVNRPPAEQFRYSNGLHAVYRMVADEGFGSLFRGLGPNVARAALMNTSQLATYDTFKDLLLHRLHLFDRDGTALHFSSSFCAGTIATTVCSPFDVIKSRVMNASGGTGMVGTITKSFRQEGLTWLFRGWTPAWIRLSPNTIIVFLTLERLRSLVDWSRAKA